LLFDQNRATQRYQKKTKDDEEDLRNRTIALASEYGRYGYRRVAALLRREGWLINDKRVQRIWRQEGLKVPQKQPKRRCAEAKKLLDDAGIEYDEHVLNEDYSIKTLVAISADTTVPQIFQNGERVGGNASLKKLLNS
jgi:glutaredoxin